jgi:hypothetical protein
VEGGADPADLGAVDGQVRRDGAVQALLDQDLGGVLGVGGDGPVYQTINLHEFRHLRMTYGFPGGVANAATNLKVVANECVTSEN